MSTAQPRTALAGTTPWRSAEKVVRERINRVSLQMRLLAITLALLVVALGATGWLTQHILRDYLVGQVDKQLQLYAESVTNAVIKVQRYGPLTPLEPTESRISGGFVAQTYDGNSGPQPYGRPDVGGGPQFESLTTAQITERSGRTYETGDVSDPTVQWRVIVAAFTDDDAPVYYSQVALPLNTVDAAVVRLRLIVLGLGAMVIAACMALAWLAIRRAFQPLRTVETTAAAIAAGDLSQRVPPAAPTTEVGRLTGSLNTMLGRIEEAFDARAASEARTRRFAADASHELRTPLASIRGFAELYRMGAVTGPEDVSRTMSRIEDEARRMGSLVDDLLLLARVDEARPGRSDEVDLAVLAGDAVLDARGLDTQRDVRLVGLGGDSGPEPAVTTGDEDRLRQVVANLVGNAVRHTPAGTPLEVAVGVDKASEQAVLEVRDHGGGLSEADHAKVFERFYRVDSSRSRGHGGGSGLGLSIVSAVVNAHGGRVDVYETSGGGATFRVELPRTTRDPHVTEMFEP